MSSKPSKAAIIERGCPNPDCEGRMTFPEDVKTVLCPKCRTSYRVYREEGKVQLREPDRKDDMAAAVAELEKIDFEITLLMEKVERLERMSYIVAIVTLAPFGFVVWSIKSALAPRGDWDEFYFILFVFLVFLFAAYWMAFNPLINRKIMKLQEERIQLRRRMESM